MSVGLELDRPQAADAVAGSGDSSRRTPGATFGQARHFLREFIREPRSMGALAPSSTFLAREMIAEIDFRTVTHAIELGPGCGALTRHILPALPPGAAFLAVECNPRMAHVLKGAFPELLLHEGSAEELPAITRAHGFEGVDCVISGLPWANLPEQVQDAILSGVLQVLKPGGHFVAYAYMCGLLLPAGRQFRRRLEDLFCTFESSPVVWRNLPPAYVYRCRKADRANGTD